MSSILSVGELLFMQAVESLVSVKEDCKALVMALLQGVAMMALVFLQKCVINIVEGWYAASSAVWKGCLLLQALLKSLKYVYLPWDVWLPTKPKFWLCLMFQSVCAFAKYELYGAVVSCLLCTLLRSVVWASQVFWLTHYYRCTLGQTEDFHARVGVPNTLSELLLKAFAPQGLPKVPIIRPCLKWLICNSNVQTFCPKFKRS
jgi:hypothetical protein